MYEQNMAVFDPQMPTYDMVYEIWPVPSPGVDINLLVKFYSTRGLAWDNREYHEILAHFSSNLT